MAKIKKEIINRNSKRIWGKFYLTDNSITKFEKKKGETFWQWGNIKENLGLSVEIVEKLCKDWEDNY